MRDQPSSWLKPREEEMHWEPQMQYSTDHNSALSTLSGEMSTASWETALSILSIVKEDTNALQWLILLHYIVVQNSVHLSPKDPHKNHTPRLAHIGVTCLLHLAFSLSADNSPGEKKFLSSSGVCVAGCKSEAWKGSCRERTFSLWLTNVEIGLLDNI